MDHCEKDNMEIDINEKEDADDSLVTMVDVLQEQEAFEENANAVLGASDEKHCTYLKGYVKRQALYACLTCCPESRTDASKCAGVCLACSLACHENHELIELYTKRNFRCDCGTSKLPSPCQFAPQKREINAENVYNQNFYGLYCECHRPYPDPEFPTNDEMIQCIICEDWWHSTHLDARVPSNDQYSEMICKLCMVKNDFLYDYSIYSVKGNNLKYTDENNDLETTLDSTVGDNVEPKVLDSTCIDNDALSKDNMPVVDTPLCGTVEVNSETEMLDSATIDEAFTKDKTALNDPVKSNSETKINNSTTIDDEHILKSEELVLESEVSGIVDNKLVNEKNDSATYTYEALLTDDLPVIKVEDNLESEMLDLATDKVELLSKDGVPAASNIFVEESLKGRTDDAKESNEGTSIDVHGTVENENIAMESVKEVRKVDKVISAEMDTDAEIKNISNDSSGNKIVNTDQSFLEAKDKTEASPEAVTADIITENKNDQFANMNDSNSEVNADAKPETGTQEESLSKDLSNDSGSVNGNDNNNFINDDLLPTVETGLGDSSKMDELVDIQGGDKEDMNIDVHPSDTGESEGLELDMTLEPFIAVHQTKSLISSVSEEIDSKDVENHAEKNNETNDNKTSDFPDSTSGISEEIPQTAKKEIENSVEVTKTSVIEQPPENFTHLDSDLENVSEALEAELLNEEPAVKKNEKNLGSSAELVTDNDNIGVDISMNSDQEIHSKNEECNKDKNALDIHCDNITENVKFITENMDVDKPYEEASDATNNQECLKDSDFSSNEFIKNIDDADSNNESNTASEQETNVNISNNGMGDGIKIKLANITDNKEQTEKTDENADLVAQEDNKENENILCGPKTEKCKRKLSGSDDVCPKKTKLDGGKRACTRPSAGAPRTKGSTFWPCSWRQRLCSCLECVSMYRVRDVLFLLDMEDTVTAYEDLGKGKNAPSQYEKGLEALSSLGHVQQINAITQYNNMKEKLLDFLKGFKDNRQVVREEDIKEFFAGMKPQRESDGVYFCR